MVHSWTPKLVFFFCVVLRSSSFKSPIFFINIPLSHQKNTYWCPNWSKKLTRRVSIECSNFPPFSYIGSSVLTCFVPPFGLQPPIFSGHPLVMCCSEARRLSPRWRRASRRRRPIPSRRRGLGVWRWEEYGNEIWLRKFRHDQNPYIIYNIT